MNILFPPKVIAINISAGGIPKRPVVSVRVSVKGLAGDGHNHAKHYRPEQAVSFQDIERLAELRHEGFPLYCGASGENINVCHLNVNALPLGTVLRFSGGVEVELTKVRTPCYVLDSIDPRLKETILGRCGMYGKVLREGELKVGESIEVIRPPAIKKIFLTTPEAADILSTV